VVAYKRVVMSGTEAVKAAGDVPVLYTYFRSSCSWRLRLVLAYKKIDYKSVPVNLLKKEQKSAEHLAVNPMGQVPALAIEGTTLTQSVSIFEYLEERFPSPALLPKDPLQRAKVREVAELICSGIQPLQALSLPLTVAEEQRKTWAHDSIVRGFTALESLLSGDAPSYCVGGALSWADICLVPQAFNASQRFGVDLAQFPRIFSITRHLEKLPLVAESHPFRQADCPVELRLDPATC